jgi:hypothetical protein
MTAMLGSSCASASRIAGYSVSAATLRPTPSAQARTALAKGGNTRKTHNCRGRLRGAVVGSRNIVFVVAMVSLASAAINGPLWFSGPSRHTSYGRFQVCRHHIHHGSWWNLCVMAAKPTLIWCQAVCCE